MSKARQLAELGNAYDDGALSNRNLIINGSFIINQRNADTAVASGTGWPCDRWNTADNQSGFTSQRNGGGYTKPSGFQNYFRSIVTTGTTKGASDYAVIYQAIEAYNIQPLKWGLSAAENATLSFRSRSNVTGTFGGAIQNHDGSMCYPFTYTISSPDTWEEQVVVIDGATTGTWNHDNGRGVTVMLGMGVGSTYSRPAGTWTTDYTFTATGAVDITGTLNNYLAITGVQLEVGDTATPFEHRSYGQELALCQRYFQKSYNTDVAVGTNTATGMSQWRNVAENAGIFLRFTEFLRTEMRATATYVIYSEAGVAGSFDSFDGTSRTHTVSGLAKTSARGFGGITATGTSVPDNAEYFFHYTASAEL